VRTRSLTALGTAAALSLSLAACGSDSNDTSSASGSDSSAKLGSITGAGSTFAAPIYSEWGANLKDKGLTVNYQATGSGDGVAQFTKGTVDFGASDSALADDELKAAEAKSTPLDIPSAFGAVTISYNVSGVEKGLKLDGATAADIFLGKVKTWNDKEIAALNSGVDLPSTAITVCHRSDSSGTTKLFTSFLAAYSPAWKSGPGVDKTVDWATGTGAKGNDGVAACVKQTDGAVGYVEEAYALQNNFTFASVKNKSGDFIEPTLESTTAAGDGLTVPDDLRFSAIDSPNKAAYPIASATFILVYEDLCKAGQTAEKAKAVKTWLDYALGDGQSVASTINYAPLPSALLEKAKAKVAGITCNGAAIS
jgi:phosphate transport system substrate-binding protein